MKNKILLVTVLYNERIEATKTYDTLLCGRKADVFVIENSPRPLNRPENLPAAWQYVSFAENPGLGAAYNHAAEYARKYGYEWLLLTDQDTTFPDGILEKYDEAIATNPSIRLFCPQVSIGKNRFMSPVPVVHYRASVQEEAPTGEIDLNRFAAINSGMLINTEAFIQAGGYKEEVKLDFSDYQFLERFKKTNSKVFVLNAVCHQEFSNEVHTKEQKMNRYRLFCQSLKHFECEKPEDKKYIRRIAFRRACSLAFSEKTFRPFTIFITDYLK